MGWSDILSAYIKAPKDGFKANLGNKDLFTGQLFCWISLEKSCK